MVNFYADMQSIRNLIDFDVLIFHRICQGGAFENDFQDNFSYFSI